MSQFGAFSPFGLLTFGSTKSRAETVFSSMRSVVGASFTIEEPGHVDASLYAKAISLGAARAVMAHALDQGRPLRAVEMLPALERTYGTEFLVSDSDDERRRYVHAAQSVRKGSRPEAIESTLLDVLGTDLVSVRDLAWGEQTVTPSDPALSGAFSDPNALNASFTLNTPVMLLNVPVTFSYSQINGSGALYRGQQLCFQPENDGLSELVTIASVSGSSAVATFTKSHDVGSTIQGYAPTITSTMRRLIVALRPAAARSAQVRERVGRIMESAVRGTTSFNIYELNESLLPGPWVVGVGIVGTTILGAYPLTKSGPFIVGQSPIGITPIGPNPFNIIRG